MGDHAALQTLSEATPTEAIHWPDVLQRAARAAWQHAVEIDGCPRQNSAYRPAHLFTNQVLGACICSLAGVFVCDGNACRFLLEGECKTKHRGFTQRVRAWPDF